MSVWAVTGGTGLVGRFIVEDLLSRGQAVVVFGRRAPPLGFFSAPVGWRQLDLDRPEKADFSGCSGLVHAAFDHVPGRYRGGEGDDPVAFRRRNLEGSRVVFERSREAGVRRVAVLSSRAVLGGYPAGTVLMEDFEPRPDSLYGEVKAELETVLASFAGPDLSTLSVRATGVYGPPGPGQRHKWAALFKDYLAGIPVAPRVATEVHGADLALGLWLALQDGRQDLVHVSDLTLDRHILFTAVNTLINSKNLPPKMSDSSPVSTLDCTRLQRLGWRPRGLAGLRAALPDMLRRLEEQDDF